jgi:chaperonin cofactor prefoldin
MGNTTMMNYHELDVLCGNLQEEINLMKKRMDNLELMNQMLNEECNALRQQLKYAEQQVYNGSTM